MIIPDSVKKIGIRAFYACSMLEKVSLPDSLEEMGESAFARCGRLHEVCIPGSLQVIPRCAFADDNGLSQVIFMEGIREIGNKSFQNCSSLEAVVLPEGVEKVDSYAWYGCSALTDLTLSSGLLEFWPVERCGIYTYLELPESVRYFFLSGGHALTEVVLPAGMEKIDGPVRGTTNMVFYYAGTPSMWADVDKTRLSIMERGSIKLYYYAEEKPEEPGDYWHYVDGRAVPW